MVTQRDVDTLAQAGRQGLYILSACTDREFARKGGGNGLFTSALLRGLDGDANQPPSGNADGFVSIDELQRYAAAKVHEWSGGTQETTQNLVTAGEPFHLTRVLPPVPGK